MLKYEPLCCGIKEAEDSLIEKEMQITTPLAKRFSYRNKLSGATFFSAFKSSILLLLCFPAEYVYRDIVSWYLV